MADLPPKEVRRMYQLLQLSESVELLAHLLVDRERYGPLRGRRQVPLLPVRQ